MASSYFFAEEFVTILGGAEYAETASIFKIFCIYGILLPLDRFTGVALDSVNMPKQNFIKVIYMTLANIIGDAVVVFGFYYIALFTSIITLFFVGFANTAVIGSLASFFASLTVLNLVAVVTIIFTLIGILVGTHYLKKELDIKLKLIIPEGFIFINEFMRKFIKI